MDEAARVIERLGRIERLRAGGAPASALLGELRGLVGEAEALAAEPGGKGQIGVVLDRLSRRRELEKEVVTGAPRPPTS
jgi:hypothetical protein